MALVIASVAVMFFQLSHHHSGRAAQRGNQGRFFLDDESLEFLEPALQPGNEDADFSANIKTFDFLCGAIGIGFSSGDDLASCFDLVTDAGHRFLVLVDEYRGQVAAAS